MATTGKQVLCYLHLTVFCRTFVLALLWKRVKEKNHYEFALDMVLANDRSLSATLKD